MQNKQPFICRLAIMLASFMVTSADCKAAIKAGEAEVNVNSTTTISLATTYQTTLRRSTNVTYRWSTTSTNLSVTSQTAYSCTIKGLSAGTAQVDYHCSYYIDGYYRTMDFYYTVTVKSGVTNLTITPTSITLNEGDTYSVTAYQSGYVGGVYFTSNNSSIASVTTDSNSGYYTYGTVTAKSEGTTYIYAKSANGATSTACTVTVKVSKKSQSLSLSSLPAMTYGDTSRQLPTTTDQGLSLSWSSSNSSVASISSGKLYVRGAGQATITASNSGNSSYYAFSRSYTLNISKASLTITANDCTRSQGEENPELTVTYSGFVNGDDASVLTTLPTVTTTATKDSPAGTYPITVSGAAAANYSITYVSGTLTITAKEPDGIEVTDFSQMDNVLYVESKNIFADGLNSIQLKMRNSIEVAALEFVLELPEGMTFDSVVLLPDRVSSRSDFATPVVTPMSDQKVHILIYPSDYNNVKPFNGNDGRIARIKIETSKEIVNGDYPLVLSNIKLSDKDGETPFNNHNIVSKLTIVDGILADANDNDDVEVGDIMAIINYMSNHPSSRFQKEKADVNGDDEVDISDIMGVVNTIVRRIQRQSANVKAFGLEPQ